MDRVRTILLVFARALILCSGLLCAFSVSGWEVAQRETAIRAGLTETIWHQQVEPRTEYDIIGMHRYHNADLPAIGSLLYLPGTNMSGALSITDENHNLWLYLANRGITVYAMDYRTHFVSHEVTSLDFMKAWTMGAFVDDAAELAAEIRRQNPGVPLFVAGFSRGVSYAYALAGKVEFGGLIALDGSFKRADPRGFDIAAALQTFDRRRDYASVLSRRGWQARSDLMSGAYEDPMGAALDDRYDTIGEQLAKTLHRAWGPGALANTEERLTPIRVLARHMMDYDWYFPSIQNIEGGSLSSHLNDTSTDLDDHFGSMTLPILYFGSTNMGSLAVLNGVYSAVRSGSNDVTLNVLEGYGHTDVLVASRARRDVYDVIERWIRMRTVDQAIEDAVD